MTNKTKISNSNSMLKDWKEFKAGRVKLRTWKIDSKTNKRTMSYTGIDDLRIEKANRLKDLRSNELKLSQSQLAQAIHVSPRTLQGWEIGRSIVPEPVLILIQLMKELPEIRKRLIPAH